MSSEWKRIINPTTDQNWFIQNKNRYGSLKFWRIWIIIYTILNILGAYIWEFIHPHDQFCNLYQSELIGHTTYQSLHCLHITSNTFRSAKLILVNMVSVLIGLICIIMMTIIRFKVPKFHDIFHQNSEIRMIIRPSLVAISYIIITLGINGILPTQEAKDINQLFVFWAFATLSVWVVYTTTMNVVKRNHYWLELPTDDDENNIMEQSAYNVAARSLAMEQEMSPSPQTLSTPAMVNQPSDSVPNVTSPPETIANQTHIRIPSQRIMRKEDILNCDHGFEMLIFHAAQVR